MTKLICPCCGQAVEFAMTEDEIERKHRLVCPLCGGDAYYVDWYQQTNKATLEALAGTSLSAYEALQAKGCFGVGPAAPKFYTYQGMAPSSFAAEIAKRPPMIAAFVEQVYRCKGCPDFDRCITLRKLLWGRTD